MEFNRFTWTCVVLLCLSVYVRSDTCNIDNCYATTGYVCNNQGSCDCGTCTCEAPYSGLTCEECPTCRTPCEVFKGCVGCKIFGTGFMGVMECISTCDYIANYIPVPGETFDAEEPVPDRMLCKHTNENMCVESFKIGSMTDGYRDLYVRTDIECLPVDLPTQPPYVAMETPYTDQTTEASDATTETVTSVTSMPPSKTTIEFTTASTVKKTLSTEKLTTSTVVPSVSKGKQTTTESESHSSEEDSKEMITSNAKENKNRDSSSVDDDAGDVLVDIEVNKEGNPDDTIPEEVGPASGQDNPSSVGNRLSTSSLVSRLLTIMCFLYLSVRLV